MRTRLESIQGTISRNRGAIAGEARADIDQALALYGQAAQVAGNDSDRAEQLLTEAEALGERALSKAQRDIDDWNGGGGPYGRRPRGGSNIDLGSIILGVILAITSANDLAV